MARRRSVVVQLGLALLLVNGACSTSLPRTESPMPAAEPPLFVIRDKAFGRPLTFIAYGDTRFTSPTETTASFPAVRQALVARIAAENPAAVFFSGDLPWHGGTVADYAVFRNETAAWRERDIRLFPALGNHEFAGCDELQCLENWWSAFPALRGRRWYAVALGSSVRAFALDTATSLLAGAPQRTWLEEQVSALPASVRYVLIWMHHPPVADLSSGERADHNPRPNEIALADYLATVATGSASRFVVIAGHVHNYERFEQDGVVYLVSGGGGAHPLDVERSPRDRYTGGGGPNFHYLRFRLEEKRLRVEMIRIEDPTAALPNHFEVRDRFEVPQR